jgi:hypothetical protein
MLHLAYVQGIVGAVLTVFGHSLRYVWCRKVSRWCYPKLTKLNERLYERLGQRQYKRQGRRHGKRQSKIQSKKRGKKKTRQDKRQDVE